MRVIRAIVVTAAALAAASIAIELGFRLVLATPLRWLLPIPQIPLYGPDPATGYRHRSNVAGFWLTEHRTFVQTSNLGLRDRDRPARRGDGPRTVVIGDSFVEALQVDWAQTSVAVAERILARDISNAEVVNLGLIGATPAVDVARLQSQGLPLAPDMAIIVVSIDHLPDPSMTYDSETVGYRRGDDEEFHLSYGFRSSRGYRFRTSGAGRFFYWLLDHSELMRAINDRKNVGLLAEWLRLPAQPVADSFLRCSADEFDRQLRLWRDGRPSEDRALIDAFVRDLSDIRRSNQIKITIAVRGIEARCEQAAAARAALVDAMRAKFTAADLGFFDLDAEVVARVGRSGVAPLYGFGATRGLGHFNEDGNRVYGEILADVIKSTLAQPMGR